MRILIMIISLLLATVSFATSSANQDHSAVLDGNVDRAPAQVTYSGNEHSGIYTAQTAKDKVGGTYDNSHDKTNVDVKVNDKTYHVAREGDPKTGNFAFVMSTNGEKKTISIN